MIEIMNAEVNEDKTSNVDKEKLEWMEKVGIKQFERPMKYHYYPGGMLYSEEYIKKTPLDELQRKFNEVKKITDGLERDERKHFC